MWRRSPRPARTSAAEQSTFRAPRLGESLAIGLGCDRTPPGGKRRPARDARSEPGTSARGETERGTTQAG